jgi:hypothetical protein
MAEQTREKRETIQLRTHERNNNITRYTGATVPRTGYHRCPSAGVDERPVRPNRCTLVCTMQPAGNSEVKGLLSIYATPTGDHRRRSRCGKPMHIGRCYACLCGSERTGQNGVPIGAPEDRTGAHEQRSIQKRFDRNSTKSSPTTTKFHSGDHKVVGRLSSKDHRPRLGRTLGISNLTKNSVFPPQIENQPRSMSSCGFR